MRLYFVDSQWLDYDTIHNNYGYTKTPTEDISSFRDTQEETWGELIEGITGFYSDLEVVHYYRGTYFVQNYTGWHTLNELCYQCNLMPSEAETEGLIFTNGTELSKAARLLINPFPGTDVESYKYLVQKRLDLGWLTEDELREYGWSKYNPEPPVVETPDYYILDTTTGAVLHSINSPLSSAKPSVVTIGGNIEHIDNPPEPDYIDVILAMKYDTSTRQFVANTSSANDWWWSCVRNQEDKDRLTAFGVRVEDPRNTSSGVPQTGFCGPYGCINDSVGVPLFRYEVIGVYSDIDGTTPISQDVSNFYTGRSSSGAILIWNTAATPSYMTWKCRITKLS